MNPFQALAQFFVSLLPAGAPEWAVGSAAMAGVVMPIFTFLTLGCIVVGFFEAKHGLVHEDFR